MLDLDAYSFLESYAATLLEYYRVGKLWFVFQHHNSSWRHDCIVEVSNLVSDNPGDASVAISYLKNVYRSGR